MTPTCGADRHVEPLARCRHGHDAGAAHVDEGLDGAAEIAHETDRPGDGAATGFAKMHVLGSDRHRGLGQPGRHGKTRNGRAEDRGAPGAVDFRRQQIGDADEVGDEGIGRLAVDLDRRCRLQDPAVAHDDDQVGHGHRLALVVGDDDGGDAEPLLQLAQFHLHGLTQFGVERRERLVEQEQLWRQRERTGDRHALALAAGELCHRPVGKAGQMDQRQQLVDALLLLFLRGAANAQRIGDVVADGQMRKQRQRLEHHAEIALVRRQRRDVLAVQHDRAAGRLLQPGDHAQERGLAAARGPEQAHEGAVRHVQLDIVDRGEIAELLGYRVDVESGHGSPLSGNALQPAAGHLSGGRSNCASTAAQPTISSVHFWLIQSAFDV